MIAIKRMGTADELAAEAAKIAAESLKHSLDHQKQATFVLAGGRVPPQAFKVLSDKYSEAFPWSRIMFLIGDERCVSFDSPDSNWLSLQPLLDSHSEISAEHKLRPTCDTSAEAAASAYAQILSYLPANKEGAPIFNHLWLSIGEDGHTLSLFPNHPSSQPTHDLVIPVHNSPKPPPDRITLTLRALKGVESAVAFISGASKAPIVKQIADGDHTLPIVMASKTIDRAGGNVTWLIDDEAASQLVTGQQLTLG